MCCGFFIWNCRKARSALDDKNNLKKTKFAKTIFYTCLCKSNHYLTYLLNNHVGWFKITIEGKRI